MEEKVPNEAVAAAYQERLKAVAGFDYVPDPMPMRNTRGTVVYYLFFASPNKTGARSYPTSLAHTVTGGPSNGHELRH